MFYRKTALDTLLIFRTAVNFSDSFNGVLRYVI